MAQSKNIILFSDGTGNSSAKLFKTNVWRLYEAVDLGPVEEAKQRQIAFYDDGVGSSAFRPLALLGGIFGYGLKRNVLEIYSYACRNYDPASVHLPESGIQEPGDHIYGFGFSRGAFTMRVAIAMIADQGIIPYENEETLQWKVRAAYKVFRRFRTRRAVQWFRELLKIRYDPERVTRKVREKTGYDSAPNHRPVIRFLGVWDTVAAYGGPFAEMTRAIDTWFYPLSMPDYRLSKHVRRARQALSLDDERNPFWPLLWDEIAEERLMSSPPEGFHWIDGARLQQVWFTGMHGDVGGGRPDESLSYVSLLWMIEEAQKCGLRTVDLITIRYRALADSFGKMHDSRSGLGAYYRYQPRKIAAWMHPVRKSTLSLRDPDIRSEDGKRQGLIRRPLIHESAIARIASGTDGYAPIVLPDRFEIVPPQEEGEIAPLATTDAAGTSRSNSDTTCKSLLAPQVRRLLDAKGAKRAIAKAMETPWDLVWKRRLAYFANVFVTLALLGWPWFAGEVTDQWAEGGADPGWSLLVGNLREALGKLILLLAAPLPELTDRWTNAWAASPILFLILVAAIAGLSLRSWGLESRLRDHARAVWHSAIPRIPPATSGQPPAGVQPHVSSALERIRLSPRGQRSLQVLKWGVLPQVIALVMGLALLWLLLAAITQLALPFMETGKVFCRDNPPAGFETARSCNDTGVEVTPEKDYVITFDVTSDWKDGDNDTDPTGLRGGDMNWLAGYVGGPFRRVVGARYLQPIAEVRPADGGAALQSLKVEALGKAGRFQARFKPRTSGRLYLFANDAVSLIDPDYFYANNHGSAAVSIAEAEAP